MLSGTMIRAGAWTVETLIGGSRGSWHGSYGWTACAVAAVLRAATGAQTALFLLLATLTWTNEAAAETLLKVERSGAGPAMLLIPGLSNGGDVWDGSVEHFKDQYEMHVVTLPGFAGTTPLPTELPFLATVRDEVIQYIVDNELSRPILVGHSLGAHLAYAVAISAPQKIGPVVAVDGLPFLGGLQNPAATVEQVKAMAERMAVMLSEMSREQFQQQNEMALRTMIRDPDEIARIAASSGASDPETVGRAISELMQSDLRDQLKMIETPILQFGAFGGFPTSQLRELMVERYSQQIAGAHDARLVEAPTLHFVMLDDLGFFVETLTTFLGEVN